MAYYRSSVLVFLVAHCTILTYGILLKNNTGYEINLEQTVQEMFQEIRTLQQELVETKTQLSNLQEQYASLKIDTSNVAFFAYLSQDMPNPPAGQTVIFDDAVTNIGNAYDTGTGIFTAPMSGSYNFAFTGASPHNPSSGYIMHIFIVKNGKRESYAFLDHSTDHWIQATASAVLHLVENDRVWVEITEVSGPHMLAGHRIADDAAHTQFSGFLIHGD